MKLENLEKAIELNTEIKTAVTTLDKIRYMDKIVVGQYLGEQCYSLLEITEVDQSRIKRFIIKILDERIEKRTKDLEELL